jgi:phospholipase C
MATNDAKHTPPLSVVVFVQENKTTDFYFPTLAKWGAAVHQGTKLLSAPPDFDQPHDRNAWVHAKMGDYPAVPLQIDNDALIPFYSWLAKNHVFSDHHFGLGSNSTPGHMLLVGGQTPTLKNPPFNAPPEWDLPSIFGHAEQAGVDWAAFPSDQGYPLEFYKELRTTAAKKKIHPPADFLKLAAAGKLPRLVYAWSPGGSDEHPPSKPDPGYMARGHDLVWQRVDAIVKAGGWDNTVFILTWDDWGGYADHVATPSAELVPDALHPKGFQVIGGSRVPLVMFGGPVGQAIDNVWHSHASVPKTVVDLLGLPAFGVPRVDQAPSLAHHVTAGLRRPPPPAHGSAIVQPAPPHPTPSPVPPPPWSGPLNELMPALVANHGKTIPAPSDGVVHPAPPVPPPLPAAAGRTVDHGASVSETPPTAD